MSEPIIALDNITVSFKQKKRTITAVNNVSVHIERGDVYGIVGYSGAGKSTLVRVINLLQEPTSGSVVVNGTTFFKHDANTNDKIRIKNNDLRLRRQKIGMIFQHFNLLNAKTVYKNVAMPLILSKKSKGEIQQKVEEMLEFVGLADKKDQYPDELSGGQKQRVAIARALVTNPKILLCDEATSALDPATTSSILDLLQRVNKTFGVTILIITHEMGVIQKICNRVAVMENGSVVELGDVKQVFSHPQTQTAKNFVSTVITTEPSKELQQIFDNRDDDNYQDYKLFLDATQINQPIINELTRHYHLNVNILFSSMSTIQDETVCYLWLRIERDNNFNEQSIKQYFDTKAISFEEVQ